MGWLRKRPPIEDWNGGYEYAITIDSGSSGSRLEIYSWIDHEIARHQANSTQLTRLPDILINGKQKKYPPLKIQF